MNNIENYSGFYVKTIEEVGHVMTLSLLHLLPASMIVVAIFIMKLSTFVSAVCYCHCCCGFVPRYSFWHCGQHQQHEYCCQCWCCDRSHVKSSCDQQH